MRKLILILSCTLFLVGCKKLEVKTALTYEEQWHENTKLVATWKAVKDESGLGVQYYVFTSDFKMSTYRISYWHGEPTRKEGYTNESYTIPWGGIIDLTRLAGNTRKYRFEGQSLFITEAGWESEFRKSDE